VTGYGSRGWDVVVPRVAALRIAACLVEGSYRDGGRYLLKLEGAPFRPHPLGRVGAFRLPLPPMSEHSSTVPASIKRS
jgi:hypothetical protein